jgi:hypothetical protein
MSTNLNRFRIALENLNFFFLTIDKSSASDLNLGAPRVPRGNL